MSKLTPVFFMLSLALIVWSLSTGISSYLGREHDRKHAAEQSSEGVRPASVDSGEIAALKATVKAEPENIEVMLQLAYMQVQEALSSSNGAMMMDAVQTFQSVLTRSPENPDALLGLASLCLQNGIIDKAGEYYSRYLKIRPEDLRAKTDYALVQFRSKQFEEGKKLVDEVLKENPGFFPAHMVLAFAYRMKGDLEKAREQALTARTFTTNERLRNEVDGFIAGLSENASSLPKTSNIATAPALDSGVVKSKQVTLPTSDSNVSPAIKVEQYVKNHTILGPKYRGLTWQTDSIALISLADFPVEQMPPFAKQVFITKAKDALSDLPEPIEMRFVDAETKKELLVIPVGPEVES